MAKSSNRIKMPDSFRVTQPTLSMKMWMGSLQQRTAGLVLLFPLTMGGQHCWPSLHWTSPHCRAEWDSRCPPAGLLTEDDLSAVWVIGVEEKPPHTLSGGSKEENRE
uniref:Uncharacterized protein n=1 Tax=Myripristis murdjan TaxID=586833 RepID=A0A667Y3K9_9TELE